MLPVLLYPKDGKKYMYFRPTIYTIKMVKNTCISDLPYGVFYHMKILSLLIADRLMYKLTFRDNKLFPQCRFNK